MESGPALLHLCNSVLVLTRGVPPVTVGHWKMAALRRYGAVPNGFVFEGGSRCGYCESRGKPFRQEVCVLDAADEDLVSSRPSAEILGTFRFAFPDSESMKRKT